MSASSAPLPHAPIRMVLGLLEHLGEVPGGREDLYKLGGPLGYELDDLLPVTDAAKRLGLVQIARGDIELTEGGRTLAQAEEPERKRLLARRLSESAGKTPAGDRIFIERACEQILSRTPSDDELKMCEQFLAGQASRLSEPDKLTLFSADKKAEVGPATDPLQRARENLIHVLMNHNDFVTIR